MALGTIINEKDAAITPQPLILVEFTFKDALATVLRGSTHPLRTADGGFQYDGNDYLPFVKSYNIAATQAVSDSGLALPPSASVVMNDGDSSIWTNYEKAIGFRGAEMVFRFIFWTVGANDFSSDSLILFRGRCSGPVETSESTLTVRAVSKLSLQRVFVPGVEVQPVCPWIYPQSVAERLSAANDDDSPAVECGYSPDVSGGNARGNFDASKQETVSDATNASPIVITTSASHEYSSGNDVNITSVGGNTAANGNFRITVLTSTTFELDNSTGNGTYTSGGTVKFPFPTCAFTKVACVARGMFIQDGDARITGRFGGSQWDPPKSFNSRSFLSGKFEEGFNTSNEAKYKDPVPLVYGTAWVEPNVNNVVGDANSTRFECTVCYGIVDDVVTVVVNGKELPAATDMTHASKSVADPLFAWYLVNRGDRDGAPNALPLYDSDGDPYGSLCTIVCVVPRQLVNSSGVPRVRVLVKGPKIREYTDVSTSSDVGFPNNQNLVWIIMDILTWGGVKYSDMDLQSFIDAAAVAAGSVTYTDNHGNASATHERYFGSVVYKQRKSVMDAVRELLLACKGILTLGSDGKIKILIKQTLGDQQPSQVSGSNDNVAKSSVDADGAPKNGYVAYKFTTADIARISVDGPSSLKISQRPVNDTPNRVSLDFQDRDDRHTPTSITIVDGSSVDRIGGHEISGTLPLAGITTQDHARRCIGTWMAEAFRGNTRNNPFGDTGGTDMFEFISTYKVIHINVGDICSLDYSDRGYSNQLIRILHIQPRTNYKTVLVRAQFHNDQHYVDTWGQEDASTYEGQRRNRAARPPFPPFVGRRQINANPDPLWDDERPEFAVVTKKGVGSFVAASQYTAVMSGVPSVNTFDAVGLRPPFVPAQGTTATTGGNLEGGKQYWMAVCAIDTNGKISAPSEFVSVFVPAGTSTNTITMEIKSWHSGTTDYALFIGTSPDRMYYYGTTTATPATVTFTGDAVLANPLAGSSDDLPMPDTEAETLIITSYRMKHSGSFAVVITGVGSWTITAANAYWTVNEWANKIVSALGRKVSGNDEPGQYSWKVSSNTSDTLTLNTGFGVEPSTILSALDLIVMRSFATTFSASTIGDAKFDNTINVEDPFAISDASNATPIVITTSALHGYSTGNKVRIDDVGGNTAANDSHTITVLSTTTFELDSSVGNGDYTFGGTARKLTEGMAVDAEVGKTVRIIAGTGQGLSNRVKSNTKTVYTFERDWATTPDGTSIFVTLEPDTAKRQEFSLGDVTTFDPAEDSEWALDLKGTERQALSMVVTSRDQGGSESLLSGSRFMDFYLFNLTGQVPGEAQSAFNLTVDGNLGIGNDLAPIIALQLAVSPSRVVAKVKVAPTGADIDVRIKEGSNIWLTLTIPAGQVSVEATQFQLDAAGEIPLDSIIQLDLTKVGTTVPGSDLSVLVYL